MSAAPDYSKLPKVAFDRESIRVFVPQEAWAVYRLLDASGQLVYLGASGRPRGRLLEHLRDGKPAVLVALEFYRSSTAMARAEDRGLAVESPLVPSGFGRRHAAWKARANGSKASVSEGPIPVCSDDVPQASDAQG